MEGNTWQSHDDYLPIAWSVNWRQALNSEKSGRRELRSVIINDNPFPGLPPEEQCKYAVRIVLFPGKKIPPGNKVTICADRLKLKQVKPQRTHSVLIRIVFFIAFQGCPPPGDNFRAYELNRIRFPIAFHELIQISCVPCHHLTVKNTANS